MTTTTPISTMGQQAAALAIKGFHVLPICWPDDQGQCACPLHHTGHNVGKAPLTPKGVNDSSKQISRIWEWWQRWPQANIAVDLARSGLLAIAPDSPEWQQRFIEYGLPDTYTVQSGGGPGHVHYIYRRPADTPLINDNRPGEYDIQPRGYVVAEGSLHQSGLRYICISEFPWRDTEDLPLAPDWVIARIKERHARSTNTTAVEVPLDLPPVPAHLQQGQLRAWWEGSRFVPLASGEVDRSATLLALARLFAKTGASSPEIVAALRNRDEALGYHKYSRRRDGGRKAYVSIAQLAVKSATYTHTPAPEPEPPPPDDDDSGFDWESYVPKRYRQSRDDEFQPLRTKLAGSYRALGAHIEANKLSRCAIHRTPITWSIGNIELNGYHCNIFGCPNCAFVNLYHLFNEKKEALNLLVMPAVYTARNVLTIRLPLGEEAKVEAIKEGIAVLHGLLTRWSQRKNASPLVRNSVQSFSCTIAETCEAKTASFGISLLANWSEANITSFKHALQIEHRGLASPVMPVDEFPLEVREQRFLSRNLATDRDEAIREFQRLAASPFQWEDPEDFEVWRIAMKRKKKVHGRGVFAKVSGSKPKGLAPTGGINPETGQMDTFTRHPNLVVPPHMVERYYSDYTGKFHYRFKAGYSMEDCIDPRSMPEGVVGDEGGGRR